MVTAILLLAAVVVVFALAVSAIKLAVQLLLWLILLPFRILEVVFKILFGLGGLVLKGAFSLVGVVAGLLAAVVVLVLVPLLPLLLVGVGLWLLLRRDSPARPAYRLTAEPVSR